ncbi:MAG: glycosyltransferase [Bryobacterales bacterium]|nr:glycosyltransferase [Bryobacterales bacterium]
MNLDSPRILILSPRQASPPTSGAKLRELHLARALGEWGEVYLAGYADRDAGTARKADLAFCREYRYVPKPKAYQPGQVARGLLTKWPLPILNYTSAALVEAAAELSHSAGFDLLQLESIHMVRCAAALRSRGVHAPLVYNWHNIESELMHRYAEGTNSTVRRYYARLTGDKMSRLEQEILRDALGHVVCSERERQMLLAIEPTARIAVIENGVDCDGFAPDGQDAQADGNGGQRSVVFVGSMDYFPNVEGAIWFAREVWPRVRKRLPELEFVIVGARPTEAVRALAEQPGVTVTGTVDSVKPYYRRALAAVVPLRTGGGTRLKILEAMAAGTPVISTALGAEGLAIEPEADYLPAEEDPELWVTHLTRLAERRDWRSALIERGLAAVRSRYDWRGLGKQLVTTYREWLGSP